MGLEARVTFKSVTGYDSEDSIVNNNTDPTTLINAIKVCYPTWTLIEIVLTKDEARRVHPEVQAWEKNRQAMIRRGLDPDADEPKRRK